MLLIGLVATAIGADFLVYGPTNGGNGQISEALRDRGHTVTVWSADEWVGKSTAQFAAFDAIVIGDPDCGGPDARVYDVLYETRDVWSPVVKGNVFLSGSDTGCHFGTNQATRFFVQATEWAASADRTGLYASSDWGRATQTPTGFGPYGVTYLQRLGDLRTLSSSGDRVALTDRAATHPVYEGITSEGLSNWRTSYHASWTRHTTFPNDFYALATNADVDGNPGTLVVHVARDECDWDGDGFDADGDSCGGTDCDDRRADVHPGVVEVCDGIDNDCNDGVDESDAIGARVWYRDGDGDGYGDPSSSVTACEQPDRYVANDDDCRDDLAAVNPEGEEVPYDGLDNDCVGGDACDLDGDGYDEDGPFCGGDDCDDTRDAVRPGATEVWYDGVDQDCDGHSDWDQDFDGHDSMADLPGGDDCNDLDATIHPGAPELADGKDNDCNGWREDLDTDGDGVFDEDEITAGTSPTDVDSDDDGIPDALEVGEDPAAPLDTDNDGLIDALDPDDDGDGIPTSVEIGDYDWTVDGADIPNVDGDGLPNHRDVDADGDGFRDEDEGTIDTDGDGVADYLDTDSDGDTVPDEDERAGDTDGDGRPDRIDDDDDGDTLPTAVEAAWSDPDVDGDTVANWLDEDADSDGTRDEDEGDGDRDGDGIPNFVDPDDLDGPLMQPERILKGGGCSGGLSVTGTAPSAGLLVFGAAAVLRRRRR